MRLVPKKYRQAFTPQADEVIRAEYRRMLHGRRPYAVKDFLETKIGVPGWACQRRAAELGLTRIKEPRWTDEELELLAHIATRTVNRQRIREYLRKRGFVRSENAVWLMLKRRLGGVRMHRSWYTANQLAGLLGVDAHLVLSWIRSGRLPASKAGSERTQRQGGDMHVIRAHHLRAFVAANPHAIDLKKVDQLWFIDLLANDRANVYSDEVRERVHEWRERKRAQGEMPS